MKPEDGIGKWTIAIGDLKGEGYFFTTNIDAKPPGSHGVKAKLAINWKWLQGARRRHESFSVVPVFFWPNPWEQVQIADDVEVPIRIYRESIKAIFIQKTYTR
jgi:hypothetical protein